MSSFHSRLALGLRRSESPEDAQDTETIAGMRRAIEKAARSSQLIQECFQFAERRHLGREEIYVLLAYRALVKLEDKHQMLEGLKTQLVECAISDDPDGH